MKEGSVIQKYRDYLNDNPKGYWFRRKLYGWGWTPARWQGWAVIAVYVVFLVWMFRYLDRASHSASDTMIGFVGPVVLATLVLVAISYWKGEPPKWMWGLPKGHGVDIRGEK